MMPNGQQNLDVPSSKKQQNRSKMRGFAIFKQFQLQNRGWSYFLLNSMLEK
jgi:hypothetical protein